MKSKFRDSESRNFVVICQKQLKTPSLNNEPSIHNTNTLLFAPRSSGATWRTAFFAPTVLRGLTLKELWHGLPFKTAHPYHCGASDPSNMYRYYSVIDYIKKRKRCFFSPDTVYYGVNWKRLFTGISATVTSDALIVFCLRDRVCLCVCVFRAIPLKVLKSSSSNLPRWLPQTWYW